MATASIDPQWLARLRAGDKAACAACIEQHSPGVYRLALRLTRNPAEAEDVVQETFLNAFTTGHMERVKIPATFRDDEELFERIAWRYGTQSWMVIPNTLHLETLYASEDLRDELAANPICEIEAEPVELSFARGRHQLTFEQPLA